MSGAFDYIVVGAGMAGLSVAAELSPTARVVVLEREEAVGYHATGRSAATFSETYGNDPVRALSRASRTFLENPPAPFGVRSLLCPRPILYIARNDQFGALTALLEAPSALGKIEGLSAVSALRCCNALRSEYVAAAALESAAADIEVNSLHQGYLKILRSNGGRLVIRANVNGIDRHAGGWRVVVGDETFTAPTLVNAAGAWADVVACVAGVPPIRIEPRRRTALIVDARPESDPHGWPTVIDIGEEFYFKPDAGRVLMSPADETPAEPSDAQADEYDIALAVHRCEQAVRFEVRRVLHSWAGLRSFVADRSPVIGFDDASPGFFWMAAQGGYGIQTAPGAARLAASLLRHEPVPADLLDEGLSLDSVAVDRLYEHRSSTPGTRNTR